MRLTTITASILATMLLLIGCGEKQTNEEKERTTIVATTGMIADAARIIVGDSAEVIGLMGPGVDPHLYKAGSNDLGLLTDADVILYNGLHLEGKMGDVLEKLAARKSVVAVAERIDEAQLRSPPEFKGAHDPHVWFDVALWRTVVDGMADTLAALHPGNAAYYRANADVYLGRLDSLDRWVRAEIATIPKDGRVLITAHDAFGYFGRAYDIEVKGLQGISTVSEFGLADRNAMVELIVARKIKAIFVESSVPRRNVESLIEGVTGSGGTVRIGGELFSDAMGEEGTPEGSYVGMVEANVRKIVEALR